MTEPRWDAVYVTLTRRQYKKLWRGGVVRVDITEDDQNQPLVVPTTVFVRLRSAASNGDRAKETQVA